MIKLRVFFAGFFLLFCSTIQANVKKNKTPRLDIHQVLQRAVRDISVAFLGMAYASFNFDIYALVLTFLWVAITFFCLKSTVISLCSLVVLLFFFADVTKTEHLYIMFFVFFLSIFIPAFGKPDYLVCGEIIALVLLSFYSLTPIINRSFGTITTINQAMLVGGGIEEIHECQRVFRVNFRRRKVIFFLYIAYNLINRIRYLKV